MVISQRVKLLFLLIFSVCFLMHTAFGYRIMTQEKIKDEESNFMISSINFPVMSKYSGSLFFTSVSDAASEKQEPIFSCLRPHLETFSANPLEKITINFSPDIIEHPFKGCDIKAFSLMSKDETEGMRDRVELPVFVTTQEPDRIYLFESGMTKERSMMLKSSAIQAIGVQDTKGNIVKLITADGYIFAAVAPLNGSFGDKGTGIATLVRGFDKERDENGDIKPDAKQVRVFTQISATPLAKDSAVFAINEPLSLIGSSVALHWDSLLNKLYVGLHIKTGVGDLAGGCALATGSLCYIEVEVEGKKIAMNTLVLKPVVSSEVLIADRNAIVGAIGSNVDVSIHHINTLHTTGGLPYLIVNGGKGEPSQTCCSVYALPLINSNEIASRGRIASLTAKIKNGYTPMQGSVNSFTSRTVSASPLSPDEMIDASMPQAVVGCGDLSEAIQEIMPYGDAVFVRTCKGIYHSQALLNEFGAVKGWTIWKQVVSVEQSQELTGSWLNTGDGCWTITVKTSCGDEIRRFSWKHVSQDDEVASVARHAYDLFNKKNKKLSLVCDLVSNSQETDSYSFLGDDIVAIFNGKKLYRLENSLQKKLSLGECIDGDIAVCFAQPVVADLGPISTAELVTDPVSGMSWLVIGGRGGLAILSDDQGNGWISSVLDELPFSRSTEGMSFKRIGNYAHVRKITVDVGFLYILTNDRFERVDFKGKALFDAFENPVMLASKEWLKLGPYGCFYDSIVSGPLAMLGTSGGLFSVAKGRSIITAYTAHDLAWHCIPIPEGLDPVVKLVVATYTGREQDLTKKVGGHIYVLSAYAGKDQSRINRFSVSPCAEFVGDILPFHDHYIESVPHSHFLNFSSYKHDFFTDGASYFSVGSQEGFSSKKTQLFGIPVYAEPRLGVRFSGARSRPIVEVQEKSNMASRITRIGACRQLAFIGGGELSIQT